MIRPAVWALLVTLMAAPARAQDASHQHEQAEGWSFGIEGSMFAVYNYQYRKFTDFDEIESQNWLMASVTKGLGRASTFRQS